MIVLCVHCLPLSGLSVNKTGLTMKHFDDFALFKDTARVPLSQSHHRVVIISYTFFFSWKNYNLLFKGSQFISPLKYTEYVCICKIYKERVQLLIFA